MSRNYDSWCNDCKKSTARSDEHASSTAEVSRELVQCLNCGSCFLEETRYIKLKTKGVSEHDWDRANKEAWKMVEGKKK